MSLRPRQPSVAASAKDSKALPRGRTDCGLRQLFRAFLKDLPDPKLNSRRPACRERLFGDGLDHRPKALPERFVAQQGHKDRATVLPTSVQNLASSQRCPHQALRVPGQPVWATQFHPELTWQDNRLRFERYFAMYSEAFGASQAQAMLDSFRPSEAANGLLRRFVQVVREG